MSGFVRNAAASVCSLPEGYVQQQDNRCVTRYPFKIFCTEGLFAMPKTSNCRTTYAFKSIKTKESIIFSRNSDGYYSHMLSGIGWSVRDLVQLERITFEQVWFSAGSAFLILLKSDTFLENFTIKFQQIVQLNIFLSYFITISCNHRCTTEARQRRSCQILLRYGVCVQSGGKFRRDNSILCRLFYF